MTSKRVQLNWGITAKLGYSTTSLTANVWAKWNMLLRGKLYFISHTMENLLKPPRFMSQFNPLYYKCITLLGVENLGIQKEQLLEKEYVLSGAMLWYYFYPIHYIKALMETFVSYKKKHLIRTP
jgi:hypothetical protein